MLSDRDRKQLSKHALFCGVSFDLISDIIKPVHDYISEFSDGEWIETDSHIGFVLNGKASVQTVDPSRRVLLRFLTAGDVFGVAGVFSPTKEISKICATGCCRCLFLSETTVSKLLDISENFRKNYINFLSNRISFLNQKIAYLTAGSAERRLALYLLSFGTREIELKDSLCSLSELLNLGRASLYRAFDRLCEDGYLHKNGRKFTVLNSEAMQNAYQ